MGPCVRTLRAEAFLSLLGICALSVAAAAPRVPPAAGTKAEYLRSAEAALASWDRALGELERAARDFPAISRERDRVVGARDRLETARRTAAADLELLKAAGPGEWKTLRQRLTGLFRRMEGELRRATRPSRAGS